MSLKLKHLMSPIQSLKCLVYKYQLCYLQSTDDCGEGSDVRTMWSEKRHANDEVEEEDENVSTEMLKFYV